MVILGIKFSYRCHLYQDDEPKIVPHVVFLVDMILGKSGGHKHWFLCFYWSRKIHLKSHILVVKVFPLKTADEASVLLDLLRIVLLGPGKSK